MKIIDGNASWAKQYCDFCQPIYEKGYAAPELGIPASVFSKEAFRAIEAERYFEEMFAKNHSWIALGENGEILGGIIATNSDPVHLSGFYVETNRQGQGIGSQLFKRALAFAGERDMELDVMRQATRSIEIYKHYGFEVDLEAAPVYYVWPYPTEEARQSGSGLRMVRRAHP